MWVGPPTMARVWGAILLIYLFSAYLLVYFIYFLKEIFWIILCLLEVPNFRHPSSHSNEIMGLFKN